MDHNIKDIISNFMCRGDFTEAESYGCGHINDTFAAYFRKSECESHRYILQRINHKVFKNPEQLMENISGITNHLKSKIIQVGGDPVRETLSIVPTIDNNTYFKSAEGDYWRVYIFIENASTYQIVESPRHFYNAGKAFGRFQKLLEDFPTEKLHETILDFHNTSKRFGAFLEALERDEAGRVKYVREEIDFVLKRKDDTSVVVDLLKNRKLPLRVTHNDTKFNNVMIDDFTGESICVIDLDTVMPGSSLYDYGDSIRSGTNSAAEDEKDLSKVWMEMELYEQFTKGFLESVGKSLTPLELEMLPFAGKLMTFECGIRFLTDHLNGDVYFKTHREGHNLDRTRTQFKLVRDMEEKDGQMKKVVEKYI
jgi:Ser/Thr protein kinase RdoA (MazF antagonist)